MAEKRAARLRRSFLTRLTPRRAGCYAQARLTSLGFASVMPGTTHLCPDPLAASSARLSKLAKSLARLRVGRALGRDSFSRWCCLRPISASARWRTTPISAWDGCWRARAGLGRPRADHPDLDAGSGATVVQAAIAVTVSAIRLFPMVVSVLPMLRTPQTKRRHLILATHFIAVTLWVECFRLLPHVPRERRIAFMHGLGVGCFWSA